MGLVAWDLAALGLGAFSWWLEVDGDVFLVPGGLSGVFACFFAAPVGRVAFVRGLAGLVTGLIAVDPILLMRR